MNSPLRDAVDGATICAISTSPGAGGIAVVRISGQDALAFGSKVFSKPLDAIADRTVAFGRFRDAEGTVLDEGLALILRGLSVAVRQNISVAELWRPHALVALQRERKP